MKLFLIPLLFTFFSSLLNAQKIEASLQPVTELKESNNFFSTKEDNLIKTNDGYISFDINMNKKGLGMGSKFSKVVYNVVLLKYDSLMNELKTNDLSGSGIRFGPFEAAIKKIDNKFYLIYFEHSQTEEAVSINASEINLSTLEISPAKNLVKYHLKDVGIMKAMDLLNKSILRFEKSPDKTKNLLFWQSGLDNSFAFSVFDKDLNVSYIKDKLIDIPEDIMITSACVDNTGNVYTGYKIESRKTGIKGHVLISQQSGKEKDIQLSEDQIYQVLVVPSKNGNMIHIAGNCFGNTDYISAVFSASLSIDKLELSNYKRTDLEEKFIESFAQNGLAFTRKNKYGLYPFHMDAFELEDGTVDIVGGLSKSKERDLMNENHSNTNVLFTSGSMLNVHFKKDNVVLSRIPRNRENFESTGDGYYALPYKNSMIVFYNDHESNLKNSLSDMPTSSDNYKNSVLVAATVSADGDIKREIVIDLKDDNFISFPSSARLFSSTTVLFPFRKIIGQMKISNKFRWGLVTVK